MNYTFNNGIYRNFLTIIILFSSFLLLTTAVMYMDKEAIGPQDSVVGLGKINGYVHETVGLNMKWFIVSEWLGWIALALVPGFSVFGLIQLIKRGSLKRVDDNILILGFFYILVALIYAFFEMCIINYRPVILKESLEASFPSSHSMVVLFIMATSITQFRIRIKNALLKNIVVLISALITIITIAARLLSGVHWFTDILGGILLGATLAFAYQLTIQYRATNG